MIQDFTRGFEWGQTIPAYGPQWIMGFREGPARLKVLDVDKYQIWQQFIVPRVDSAVQSLGYASPADPSSGTVMRLFEWNAALVWVNNLALTPDEVIKAAVGIQNFMPDDLQELMDNKRDSRDVRDAIGNGTAFGRVPPGV